MPTAAATAKKIRKNNTSRAMVSSSTVTSLAETLHHGKSTCSWWHRISAPCALRLLNP